MYFSFTQIWDLGAEKGRKSCNISSSHRVSCPAPKAKPPHRAQPSWSQGGSCRPWEQALNSHSTVPTSHQQSLAYPGESTQL